MPSRIGGVFLKPGVSLNRRMYTPANIGRAVARMQNALSSSQGLPLTMATSHDNAYSDNALATVGRITKVAQLPTGEATWEAELANTAAGRDIAQLANPKNPFIKGVSIRGMWLGDVQKVKAPDGEEAETADDLEISGIDFTGRPGVEGAQITYALAESQHLDSSYVIHESLDEVRVSFTEETAAAADEIVEADEAGNAPGNGKLPYGNASTAKYADPGYQKDGKKRYPLNNPGRIRAAWGYINHPANAAKYTSNQVASIKKKIKAAAGKSGIDISAESDALISGMWQVIESYGDEATIDDVDRLIELTAEEGMYGPPPDDDNMEAGAEDNEPCDYCGNDVTSSMMFCPTCGQPVPQAESSAATDDVEEAVVADTETDKNVVEAKFTIEDVHAAYAAGVAANNANAGPKNAMGMKAGAKSPGATGTGDSDDESEDESEDENKTESTQEGGKMTEAKVSETFTSEALEAIVAKAVKKATKAAVEAMTAASATAAAAASETTETEMTTEESQTLSAAEIEAIKEAAREEARKEAVAEYRSNGTALRKGLVKTDADAEAAESWDPAELAKLSPEQFRKRAAEAFSSPAGMAWSPQAPRLMSA